MADLVQGHHPGVPSRRQRAGVVEAEIRRDPRRRLVGDQGHRDRDRIRIDRERLEDIAQSGYRELPVQRGLNETQDRTRVVEGKRVYLSDITEGSRKIKKK